MLFFLFSFKSELYIKNPMLNLFSFSVQCNCEDSLGSSINKLNQLILNGNKRCDLSFIGASASSPTINIFLYFST